MNKLLKYRTYSNLMPPNFTPPKTPGSIEDVPSFGTIASGVKPPFHPMLGSAHFFGDLRLGETFPGNPSFADRPGRNQRHWEYLPRGGKLQRCGETMVKSLAPWDLVFSWEHGYDYSSSDSSLQTAGYWISHTIKICFGWKSNYIPILLFWLIVNDA